MLRTLTLKVENMMCAHCSASVEKTFQRVGIKANVNLSKNTVRFTYDDEKIPLSYLQRLVKQQGYNLVVEKKKSVFNFNLFSLIVAIVTLVVSVLGMINMILMDEKTFNIHLDFFMFFDSNLIKLIFATISLLILGTPFIYRAILSIKMKRVGMDLLIAISSLASYILSLVLLILDPVNLTNVFKMGTVTYFDSTMMILSIIFIGHNITDIVKAKSVQALNDVSSLIPNKANMVVNLESNDIQSVDVDSLQIGDICLVKTGEQIPTDSVVIKSNGSVDEKILTGESTPRYVKENDEVFLSTTLLNGPIYIKVLKPTSESLMSNIVNESYALDNKKGNLNKISDVIASWFVLAIFLVSVFTFLLNYFYLCKDDIATSIVRSITVLVVSCPCAFGLAVPLSSLNGFYLALKNGILFKTGDIFEKVKNIKIIFFDKTGTLTKGELKVIKNTIPSEYFSCVNIMEESSTHPIATSIKSYLKEQTYNTNIKLDVKDNKEMIGLGIQNKDYKLGSVKLIKDTTKLSQENLQLIKDASITTVCLLYKDELVGLLQLEDEVIDDAKQAIAKLKKDTIRTILISGDLKTYTLNVGEQLGFEKEDIYYEVLPNMKKDIIEKILSSDKNLQKQTCYVGDGVNDILALSAVNLKIASYKASEVTKAKANCIMLKDDISSIEKSIRISKKVYLNIIFNFVWAFLYNLVLIPLAMLGLFSPTVSAILMIISSLTLVLNSSLLKYVKLDKSKKNKSQIKNGH